MTRVSGWYPLFSESGVRISASRSVLLTDIVLVLRSPSGRTPVVTPVSSITTSSIQLPVHLVSYSLALYGLGHCEPFKMKHNRLAPMYFPRLLSSLSFLRTNSLLMTSFFFQLQFVVYFTTITNNNNNNNNNTT